jgi:predicted aconitase with swiveling domain
MVYLKIENKTEQAKAVLALLKTMPFVEIVEAYEPNATTKRAMMHAEEGKVEVYGNANALLDELKK